MNININTRGNGACTLCKKESKCQLIKKITDSLHNFNIDETGDNFEMVIYRCPLFEEHP